jgi:hypothetical protein
MNGCALREAISAEAKRKKLHGVGCSTLQPGANIFSRPGAQSRSPAVRGGDRGGMSLLCGRLIGERQMAQPLLERPVAHQRANNQENHHEQLKQVFVFASIRRRPRKCYRWRGVAAHSRHDVQRRQRLWGQPQSFPRRLRCRYQGRGGHYQGDHQRPLGEGAGGVDGRHPFQRSREIGRDGETPAGEAEVVRCGCSSCVGPIDFLRGAVKVELFEPRCRRKVVVEQTRGESPWARKDQ